MQSLWRKKYVAWVTWYLWKENAMTWLYCGPLLTLAGLPGPVPNIPWIRCLIGSRAKAYSCWTCGVFLFSTVKHSISLPSWFHFFSAPTGGKPTSHLPLLNIASCLTTHQLPLFSTQCPQHMGNARDPGVILEILCAWPCHPVLQVTPRVGLDIFHSKYKEGKVWQASTALIITIIRQTYCFPLGGNWKREVCIQHLTSQKH